jgi:hypothetical protein
MSYRPDEQSIEDPARAIVRGITHFQEAVEERIKSDNWKSDHIANLTAFASEMTDMKYRLMQLAEENW